MTASRSLVSFPDTQTKWESPARRLSLSESFGIRNVQVHLSRAHARVDYPEVMSIKHSIFKVVDKGSESYATLVYECISIIAVPTQPVTQSACPTLYAHERSEEYGAGRPLPRVFIPELVFMQEFKDHFRLDHLVEGNHASKCLLI
jgi:hypothetical protein